MRKVGTYNLIKEISSGSFGYVYKCTNKEGKDKAIKKFLNVSSYQDFIREYTCSLYLNHENLINIEDIVFEDGEYYTVMPLYDMTLCDYIHSKILTDDEKVDIIVQILKGLEYLHASGFVHCDLKSRNILVKINKTGINVVISDFGLCRYVRDIKSIYFSDICTVNYRPPEYILSALNPRYTPPMYSYDIDMWSFGCIMYEVVNRGMLFDGGNELSIMKKIVSYIGIPDPKMFKGCRNVYEYSTIKLKQLNVLTSKMSPLFPYLLRYDNRYSATRCLDFLDIKTGVSFRKTISNVDDKSVFSEEAHIYIQKIINEIIKVCNRYRFRKLTLSCAISYFYSILNTGINNHLYSYAYLSIIIASSLYESIFTDVSTIKGAYVNTHQLNHLFDRCLRIIARTVYRDNIWSYFSRNSGDIKELYTITKNGEESYKDWAYRTVTKTYTHMDFYTMEIEEVGKYVFCVPIETENSLTSSCSEKDVSV